MRSEIMPGLVEGHVESVLFADLFREFNQITTAIHVENLIATSFRFVLLYNPQWNIQQPDIRGDIRLFSPDMNPPASVLLLYDILLRQTFQVGISQTGERRKDEPVADTLQVGFVELCRHQFRQVLVFQMTAFALRQCRMQFIVRSRRNVPWLKARLVIFSSGTSVHARSSAAYRNRFAGTTRNHHKNPGRGFSR